MGKQSAAKYFEFEKSIFAKRLTEIMDERKLKHTDLAKITGFQRQTISLYVNDQSRPDTERLTILADRLGVSADWLLGRSEHRNTDVNAQAAQEYTGLNDAATRQMNTWRQQAQPKVSGGYVTTTGGNVYAQSVLDFLNALICSDEVGRLAERAGSYCDYMGRGFDDVEIVVRIAEAVSWDMTEGKEPETKLIKRDFAKAISGSNLMLEEAGKHEYMMIKLLGVFLERLAGHDEQELWALQRRLGELQSIILGGDAALDKQEG